MRKSFFALLVLGGFAVFSSAQQQQTPPAPVQSPRQALIEMANGQVVKHLTVEVQQLLNQAENKQALLALGMTSSLKSELGQDVQIFDSGPVLASLNQPGTHRKIEIHIDNDDMSGDQDTIELSIHSFHDGAERVEQDEAWQTFVSHFTVTMVRQQNLWRLSKIGVGVELAVGDPEFLKKTYLKSQAAGINMVGGGIGPEAHTSIQAGETVQRPEMTPNQLAVMIGFAEQSFAREHADVGFTCSLADLAEGASAYGLDPQIATGSYKGYKISLTGCPGKPAGSFQFAVEPMPGKSGKAFCVDATQNLRVSDDGRGATCLSSGRPEHAAGDESGVGLTVIEPAAKPKE
ncbi:MAG TPA: hypothetical protein VKW06_06625 [Candidatus Angelobacter sp.]|nr:hypothetical protein [Candidatus Angelobacter sp.]